MNETRAKLLNTSQAWVWVVLLVAVLSVGFYHAGVGAATGLLVSVRSPGLSLPYPPDRRLLRRWCISGALPLRNRAASIASIRAAACASDNSNACGTHPTPLSRPAPDPNNDPARATVWRIIPRRWPT